MAVKKDSKKRKQIASYSSLDHVGRRIQLNLHGELHDFDTTSHIICPKIHITLQVG